MEVSPANGTINQLGREMVLVALEGDKEKELKVRVFDTDMHGSFDAKRYADTTLGTLYTWVSGDGDALLKGWHFVNRFLYVVLPAMYGNPDHINLKEEEEDEDDGRFEPDDYLDYEDYVECEDCDE